MEKRLDYHKVAPQAQQAMRHLYSYVKECGLDIALLDMVWLQIGRAHV